MTDIISPLLKKLTDLVLKKAESLASVRGDLSKLEKELQDIQPFLRDAHDKQFTRKGIKNFVSGLNAVVYDAEDVIDLYSVNTKTNEDYDTQTQLQKVCKLFHFFCQCLSLPLLFETANEIEEINERLRRIWIEKDLYGLVPVMGESRSSQAVGEITRVRQTISLITETQVFGREKDEQLVVEWLTNERGESTRVVAIVGMGGCGKTTLAQKVYHNPNICEEHFEKRMWVCVSEKSQESELFKKILEAACGEASRVNELDALCTEITKRLKQKRFLLVLDDLWDHGWWKNLNAVLQVGAVGSKVLITTRKKNVAIKMDASYLHQLECLSDDESWSLFKAKVLKKDEKEEVLDGLNDIGRVIAEKCKGLPLALNVVGSLLRNKERTVSAWQQVAGSPSWGWKDIMDHDDGDDNVVSAIALSYINLPFPLKQCFTYCCIFPKDFEMEKVMLVRLWVEEGFVSEDEGWDAEALAEGYLEALVDCSLIERFEKKSHGNKLTCYKLHDIVHDFALFVRGQERLDAISLRSERASDQARFFFSSYKDEYPREALGRETKLRTLLLTRTIGFSLEDILCFRWLRVLDLNYQWRSGYGNEVRQKFPCVLTESLGKLALLKYLSVYGMMDITALPESIAGLRQLQRLDIGNTLIKILPEGISQMNSLRHLHLEGMSELKHLPKEIGRLTLLQTLERFIVGSDKMDGSGSGIAQLHHLNSLRGSLHIQHIERVGSREEAEEAELERKVNLQKLKLSCGYRCLNKFDEEFARKVEGIYEELRPPTGLKKLTITNYAGMSLPTWLSTAGYKCLEDVTLVNCEFLEQLPSLGCLPNLVSLSIVGASKVKIIDDGFHGGGRQAGFPKLERLTIRDMKSLEQWTFNAQGGTLMPRLKFLEIYDCPKLRALPDSLRFTTPNELRMSCLPELVSTSLPSVENMRELVLCEVPKLNLLGERGLLCGLKAANVLRSLKIRGCINMDFESKMLLEEAMESMVSVEELGLLDCPDLMASIADVLKPHHLPNLLDLNFLSRHLSICGSQGRSSIDFRLSVDSEEMGTKMGLFRNLGSRVKRLDINLRGRKVASLPEWVQHFHQLEELSISESLSLTHLPGWLCEFSELRRLELYNLPKLRCLPDAMQGLTRLEGLSIRECPSLTHLPGWLCELSELRRLSLYDLPELRSLPDAMQGLTRLKELSINKCPSLTHLPGLLCESSELRILALGNLPKLRSLPDALQGLIRLEQLTIEKCPSLTDLPGWLCEFSELWRLQLENLPELRSLPDAMQGLTRLEELHISGCPQLKERCRGVDKHKISHIPDVFLED